MIISRTPFRISFVGGGTDLKEFYREYPGSVLCTSIDKYIYLSIHKYFYPGKHMIKYSRTEQVSSTAEIQHELIREVFNLFNIEDADFNSTADIPAGTGMGSSSAFTCGLINLCSVSKGIRLTKAEIARLACEIEIEKLGAPIGKQDQYGCAMGGMNYIQFYGDETVEIKHVNIEYDKMLQLQDNLLLFYTATTRSANSILSEQKENTLSNAGTKETLQDMAMMAEGLYKELIRGNIDSMGAYLHEGWMRKKKLATKVTNTEIDNLHQLALKNGATGGKLLGAGGGGFLLFYVPREKQDQLRKALKDYREFPFAFDHDGTKIIFNNEEPL